MRWPTRSQFRSRKTLNAVPPSRAESRWRPAFDDAVLELLVRSFYAAARQDEVIGHLFDGVADWEKHIAKVTTFWSSVGLLTGRYHGQPLAAHFPLRLEPLHFARWLVLFEQTARVAVSRGEFPSRIGASHGQ